MTDSESQSFPDDWSADGRWILYLDREAMNAAARVGNPRIERFCNACFTGEYPTPDVTLERLRAIEAERSEHRDNASVC